MPLICGGELVADGGFVGAGGLAGGLGASGRFADGGLSLPCVVPVTVTANAGSAVVAEPSLTAMTMSA